MPYIKNHIDELNSRNRKALSIFLTAGFPTADGFVDLAKSVLDSGADMIEIGIPFSDPLADGPVIQQSSQTALQNGVNIKMVFNYASAIASYSPKPVILMGYANPLLRYGMKNFYTDSLNSGVKGIIIPDIPVEEYDDFFAGKPDELDTILLATPTSGNERIKRIDKMSSGFVYCVSMTGTTGGISNINQETEEKLREIRGNVTKNKMMIGFGITKPDDIISYKPFCDGVIVGSAVIKRITETGVKSVEGFINELSLSCR